jgi:prepilin-type N-terminal cleavage/methylation domain-containing protein
MSSTAPRSSRQQAFTLIELLTVIAIIGILAAIIIPTVGLVRKRAATASDTSNLRQIGTGLMLHVSDNKGYLPNPSIVIAGTSTGAGQPDRWTFQEAVDRYFGKGPKFNATSIYNWLSRGNMWYSRYAEASTTFVPPSGYLQTQPLAYSYNPYITNTRWKSRLASVPTPSRTVIVGEVNNSGGSMTINAAPELRSDVDTKYRVSREGKALYLYCDGRVALLSGDQSEPELTRTGAQNIWRWW